MSSDQKTEQSKRSIHLPLSFLVGIVIPMVLLVAWHAKNVTYPRDDEADFIRQSQAIFLAFKASGFWAALKTGYFVRGFRPVIQTMIGALFLVLTGGRVLPAVAISLSLLYVLLLTYVYKLAEEFTTPWRACLVTLLMGTLPWLFRQALFFNTDIFAATFSVAALYHLVRSDFARSLKHTALAGVWIGVALCVRPIETAIMYFLVPTGFYLYYAYKRGAVRRMDIGAVMIITIVSGLFLGHAAIHYQELSPLWVPLLLSPLGFLFWMGWKRPASRPFLAAFSVAYAAGIIWYTPEVYKVYDWAYSCSLGQFILYNGPFMPKNRLVFLGYALGSLIGYQYLWVLALAAVAQKKPRISPLLICVLPAIFLPITIEMFFQNGTDRYWMTGAALAYLVAGILAVRETPLLPRVRPAALLAVPLLHTLFLGSIIFDFHPRYEPTLDRVVGFNKWMIEQDNTTGESFRILRKIGSIIPKDAKVRIVSLYFLNGFTQAQEAVNPYMLWVMAREGGASWEVNYPYVIGAHSREAQWERVRNNFEYALVTYDHLPKKPVSQADHVMEQTYLAAGTILEAMRKHSLESIGVKKLLDLTYMPPDRHEVHLALFKIQPQKEKSEVK